MIKNISNIRLNIGESDEKLKQKACKVAGFNINEVKTFSITKKSLDARKKNDIHYVCSVLIASEVVKEEEDIKYKYNYPKKATVVVGSGPAGLFCALKLARNGFNPIVIERGKNVDDRKVDIENFIKTHNLNTESNIQFGEGGAGTFSDGKLNTGVSSELKSFILKEFVAHGAHDDILYSNKPHIGSDVLPTVVKNIRKEIEYLGGSFLFNTLFTEILTENGNILGIKVKNNGNESVILCENLVVAIGHSSRDTYYSLYNSGVEMEAKDTAIGFRIEHIQDLINKSQYGDNYDKRLPVADYKLVSHASGRGVFTFCMCPGGYVMPATSEKNAVVTNGMSNYLRDGVNANSAVVVQIKKEDYQGDSPLSGIKFIEDFERKAFEWGGGDYSAPCQLVGDYLKNEQSLEFKSVKPTYPWLKFAPLHDFYPKEYTLAIQKALLDMDKRIKGFANYDAVLTAPETRTSSPVRIVRGEDLSSVSFNNLYPAGEVGYAGGIMSSAIDGLRIAEQIMKKYR